MPTAPPPAAGSPAVPGSGGPDLTASPHPPSPLPAVASADMPPAPPPAAGSPAVPALEVHDLTVSYHRKPVLWNVDLAIPAGKLVGIIGPNGPGRGPLRPAVCA